MNERPVLPPALFDIPELDGLGTAEGLVRIPMELDVPFTPRVRAIVDTAEFQRLGRISQLGLVSRVYPGATHTRFEHALGVFHNAIRYLRQLAADDRFRATVDRHGAEVLLVASLLHDLGHWPFCHPIEDMGLPDLPPHEEFAAEFLATDSELASVLRTEWNIEPDEVLDVLVKRSDSPRLRLLRSILSGPIDVDKMDYLDRDSLHAGVPYGRNFDRNRLIRSLVLNEAGDGLAITVKGKTAAELMVFARYVMFSEVYWHHAVRAATTMFARTFHDVRHRFDPRALFRKSDADMVSELRTQARGTRCERLMEGLFGTKRALDKRVVEYSEYQSPELYRRLAGRPYDFLVRCAEALAERLSAEIGVSIGPTDVLLEAPPPHREVEFDVSIHYPKERLYRPLHEVSPVVETLARRQFDDYVKRVRIFANPEHASLIAAREDFQDHLMAAITDCDG